MYFVWSWWYLVVVLAIAIIAGLIFVFVKMNKEDYALIDEFQKQNAAPAKVKAEPKAEEQPVAPAEVKVEEQPAVSEDKPSSNE